MLFGLMTTELNELYYYYYYIFGNALTVFVRCTVEYNAGTRRKDGSRQFLTH